jgi:hypothetical protein
MVYYNPSKRLMTKLRVMYYSQFIYTYLIQPICQAR